MMTGMVVLPSMILSTRLFTMLSSMSVMDSRRVASAHISMRFCSSSASDCASRLVK